jgi:cytochrome bd-type quinol oxidase subunit 2
MPTLMIIGGVAFDLATPPRFTAVPFFAAAPLMAAPFSSWLATLLTGVVAGSAMLGLHFHNQTVSQVTAYAELFTLLTVSGLALLAVSRPGEG